jgi:hypothetical protein
MISALDGQDLPQNVSDREMFAGWAGVLVEPRSAIGNVAMLEMPVKVSFHRHSQACLRDVFLKRVTAERRVHFILARRIASFPCLLGLGICGEGRQGCDGNGCDAKI